MKAANRFRNNQIDLMGHWNPLDIQEQQGPEVVIYFGGAGDLNICRNKNIEEH